MPLRFRFYRVYLSLREGSKLTCDVLFPRRARGFARTQTKYRSRSLTIDECSCYVGVPSEATTYDFQ